MKKTYTFLLISLLAFSFNLSLFAQTTYTWIGANNASWATSTNWTPTRTTLATNDLLVFNTGTTLTITAVPTQTIGRLTISNNSNITLNGTGGTLTIGNQTGDDLAITTGSSLTLGTSGNITLAVGATANISGTLTINSGRRYDTDGTLVVTTVSGRLVNSGTVTSTTATKLVFSSTGYYIHQQNGATIPAATWDITSTCLIAGVTANIPGGMGQTFGHLDWNCTLQTTSTTLGATFSVGGDFNLVNTGTGILQIAAGTTSITGNYFQSGGIIRLAGGSARILNVSGNFTLSGGEFRMSGGTASGNLNLAGNLSYTSGMITETSSGNGTILFNGSTNQNITGGGTITNTINFTINNPAGITLLSSVIFPAALTMTNGNINLNGNLLTLGTGSTAATKGTLTWTSGLMTGTGTFTRWFDNTTAISLGTNAGLFPMGNGTDNRSVWFAGTPSVAGTLSVQHSNQTGVTDLTGFTDGGISVNRRHNMNWTLSTANGFNDTNGQLRIQVTGIHEISVVADLRLIRATDAVGTSSNGTGSTLNPQVNRTALTGANYNNTFYFGSNSSVNPLPVELSSFSAVVLENGVKLKWRTETEVNNFGFEIERADINLKSEIRNPQFLKLGFIEGNGNSNSPKNYFFVDENVNAGKYEYRLKQIDTDGNFEYSKTIEVDLGLPRKFELSQNFPNPFNPSTTISFTLPESGNIILTVYNIIGEQVEQLFNGYKEAGIHTINFNASELNSGIYIYKIEANGLTKSRKMMLVK